MPDTFEAHAALMFDLLAVAYQSDVTRVFSFMMSREASQRTYPELNIPQTHHDVSHHGGNADNMERHAKINIHYAQLFARVPREARSRCPRATAPCSTLADLLRRRDERRPGACAVSAAAHLAWAAAAGKSKAIVISCARMDADRQSLAQRG